MAELTLFYHPLSSYCWKVLIALYEHDLPFTPVIVDLSDPAQSAALKRLWPIGKFPVLQDGDEVIPESTIIIEYLEERRCALIPAASKEARRIRLADRFFDLYLHDPMQRIVADRLRPADKRDPFGVEQARAGAVKMLDMFEQRMGRGQLWAMSAGFSLADCAAIPPLFYLNKIMPLSSTHPSTVAYLDRVAQRPSFARVLKEAEPYFKFFPG